MGSDHQRSPAAIRQPPDLHQRTPAPTTDSVYGERESHQEHDDRSQPTNDRVDPEFRGLDEVVGPPPDSNPNDHHWHREGSLEETRRVNEKQDSSIDRPSNRDVQQLQSLTESETAAVDPEFEGVDEVVGPAPDSNPTERTWYHRPSLEENRASLEERRRESKQLSRSSKTSRKDELVNLLFTSGWLVFFSIWGTLARLGTEWLTRYPNAPVQMAVLWANVGGSFALGFLQEDRMLFAQKESAREERSPNSSSGDLEQGDKELSSLRAELDRRKEAKDHLAFKKKLPLYIGASVGFCGSYTSFSSFILDAYLGLANDTLYPGGSQPRNPGWSVCAVLAVLLTEVSLSLVALSAGAHFSELMMPLLGKLPGFKNSMRLINHVGLVLGFGCWLGAVLLAIWPPYDPWRGRVLFSLVFTPPGCLLRFFLAIKLNPLVARFPLGTFIANIFGTLVLAGCFGPEHHDITAAAAGTTGTSIARQVLDGMVNGFCGALTTVSTWITELKGLRKSHAYTYGLASIGIALSCFIAIVGPLQWSNSIRI